MSGMFLAALILGSTAQAFIYGGEAVEEGSPIAKSTVALTIVRNDRVSTCSGTLIARDLVLTAAHCLDRSPRHVYVTFGADVSSGTMVYVRAHTSHQRYRGHYFDIALMRIDPDDVPSGFRPAFLYGRVGGELVDLVPRHFRMREGMYTIAAGYGRGRPSDKPPEERGLNWIPQWLINNDADSSLLFTFFNRGNGLCYGDSGGPLYVPVYENQLVLIGVIIGTSDENCSGPFRYEATLLHSDWIEEAAEALRETEA